MHYLLPESPQLETRTLGQIIDDYERFKDGLPERLEEYLLEKYRLDVSSAYGTIPIKNPFGKASGQLSMTAHQIQTDADAGLAFSVLKTVIAQNREGQQMMKEWAIEETHMRVEKIRGRSGEEGWTVTWKGRGWHKSFEEYLDLFAQSLEIGNRSRMLIVPSCKYHLPSPQEDFWKEDEYKFTTGEFLKVWAAQAGPNAQVPMPIEKDFSPTLAGSDRAASVAKIIEWLLTTTRLIKTAARPAEVLVGLKIFNAMFEDEFQLEMLKAVRQPQDGSERADFLIYANRLFDPEKEFEGKRGVAYGGPDLSDRNLKTLSELRRLEQNGELTGATQPISATGNITSGRMAIEYLLRGCSSFQMHTLFQLPDSEFAMKTGNKVRRALHRLYFDPQNGFIAWLLHLRRKFDWPEEFNVEKMAKSVMRNKRSSFYARFSSEHDA